MAARAKTGSLIEDSSWSVSHRGWAELACSDFTPMNANFNGGLLSDPMLRTSLGSEGVGGWEKERSRTTGFKKYNFNQVFFKVLTQAILCGVMTHDHSVIITIMWG